MGYAILTTASATYVVVVILDLVSRKMRRKRWPMKSMAIGSLLFGIVAGVMITTPLVVVLNARVGSQAEMMVSGPVIKRHFGKGPYFVMRDTATGLEYGFRAAIEEVRALQVGSKVTRHFRRGCLGIYYQPKDTSAHRAAP